MGAAVARGLRAAGCHVTVWNRSREKAQALAGDGILVAGSAAEAIGASNHIIVVLNDAAGVRDVMLSDEVRAALPGKAVAVSVAMNAQECVELAVEFRAVGSRLSDVQIITYPAKVEARDSEFILACDRQDRDAWWVLFSRLASRLHDVGEVGNACKAQLGISMSSVFMTSAISYSVAAFAQMGLPIGIIQDLLSNNPDIRIPQADYAVPEMFKRDYGDGPFTVGSMISLLDWLIDSASEMEIEPGPLAEMRELYQKAADKGFHDRNATAVYEVVNPSRE
jgi:3-hydroxyisobutyrate dehydrogenase